jgi:adenosylcobinamide-phosphate synthase
LLFYTIEEILLILLAAIFIDLILGDPRWIPHPVVMMGRFIRFFEKRLYPNFGTRSVNIRLRGMLLTVITVISVFLLTVLITFGGHWLHPWVGYSVSIWLISTTIAIKGLKDAALLVYIPLAQGDLQAARKYVGQIVGRDTDQLNESEITRATVETVAENTVDAVVSPLFYALLGGAPLAVLYRGANTLDSMVGYKNEKYLHFGWVSARWDDILNWLPARITGILLVVIGFILPNLKGREAWGAIQKFADQHPSPNSGIPESAVAGALGIQLGGTNVYEGSVSERARMGWPTRELNGKDILQSVYMLYGVSFIWAGGLLCAFYLFK